MADMRATLGVNGFVVDCQLKLRNPKQPADRHLEAGRKTTVTQRNLEVKTGNVEKRDLAGSDTSIDFDKLGGRSRVPDDFSVEHATEVKSPIQPLPLHVQFEAGKGIQSQLVSFKVQVAWLIGIENDIS